MRALIVPLVVIALAACPKDTPPETAPVAPATSTTPGPVPLPPRIEGPVGDLLESYEAMRARLAADDAAGAMPLAEKMLAAARIGTEKVDKPEAKAALTAIGDVTQKLTLEKPADIEKIRAAFGEVSKQVVTLMVVDEKLREGRFLFECPMAKGYQKWVQTTAKLNNPYFGKSMLDCGSDVPWKV